MIEIQGVSKTYVGRGGSGDQGGVEAVRGVELSIGRGQIFGIIGASGAGKSSLLRCLNLLEKPTSGKIWIDGSDLTCLSEAELRQKRQKIGMIFQHFNLLSSRTVAQNVAFPLEIARFPAKERKGKVEGLLELVGLTDRANYYPAQLSGGQKQRVGIARALANDPSLLLCDEATSALDPTTTRSILNLIQEIQHKLGLTVVLITHEMGVIWEICDRVAVMDQGQIVELGEVKEVFSNPQSKITQELLGQVQLPMDKKILEGVGDRL